MQIRKHGFHRVIHANLAFSVHQPFTMPPAWQRNPVFQKIHRSLICIFAYIVAFCRKKSMFPLKIIFPYGGSIVSLSGRHPPPKTLPHNKKPPRLPKTARLRQSLLPIPSAQPAPSAAPLAPVYNPPAAFPLQSTPYALRGRTSCQNIRFICTDVCKSLPLPHTALRPQTGFLGAALSERSLRDLQKQINFERHLQAARTKNDHARVELLKHDRFWLSFYID